MLTSLHIQEFKGLRDINIPEMRKVNLILGGQNVGKTSLLEAIVFVTGDAVDANTNGALGALPRMFRPCEGADDVRFWRGVVGTESKPIAVRVEACIDEENLVQAGFVKVDGAHNSWDLHLNAVDHTQTVCWYSSGAPSAKAFGSQHIPRPFPSFARKALEQVELYGQLLTLRKKKAVVRLLKDVEPRLESVDSGAPDGEHRIYVELSDHDVLLPLSDLGHGFTRLFELYAGLAATESKLALIDEIENGIHYMALPKLFEGVLELSGSNGVQSIITTHSWECIRAAYKTFADADSLKDFQLIRLERDADNIRAVIINDEMLDTVMEAGYEIR